MPIRRLLTTAEVAQRLHMSVERFYRCRDELIAEYGFPAAVPGCGHRWDPFAIDKWLDRKMPGHLQDQQSDTHDGDPDYWDRELARRLTATTASTRTPQ